MINSLRVRTNSPWLTMWITAAAYLTFIVVRLGMHNGDASVFVAAGDRFVDARQSPAGLAIRSDSDGYDGQFYYRLALDPFTTRVVDFGISLSVPVWRQQRIVYPLLARMLALEQAGAIPAALIAVNLLALCGIGWLGGAFAQALNCHALLGLVLPLYPGFLFALARDTAEILEVSLALAGMWCVMQQRAWWAALFFTLAVLTKETALLAVVGVFAAYVLSQRKTIAPQAFVIPAIVLAVWHRYLFNQWGQWPVASGIGNLGWPLAEFVALAGRTLGASAANQRTLIEAIFIVMFAAAPLIMLRASRTGLPIKMAWLLYGLLTLTFSAPLWIENMAYFRAVTDFYAWGMLIVLGATSRWRWPVLMASLPMWIYSFSWTLNL